MNLMLIVTIENIPGRKFEVLGYAKGSVVHSKNLGKDIMAGLKTLVGGEMVGYTEMLNEARQIAVGRMVEDATAKGADAIVGLRFTSSTITTGAAEVTAFGTAVKFVD